MKPNEQGKLPAGEIRPWQDDRSNTIGVVLVKLDEPLLPGQAYDSPGNFVLSAIRSNGFNVEENDLVVVTSKIVSILERRCHEPNKIKPSFRARILGRVFDRDPGLVQLILSEGRVLSVLPVKAIFRDRRLRDKVKLYSSDEASSLRLLDSYSNVFMIRRHGIDFDDAGIDAPNMPSGWVALLPKDSCQSAKSIREEVRNATSRDVAVIITDTSSVKGRPGSQDIAIGFSGIDPIKREHARKDLFGTPKPGGMDLTVDSISGFAGAAMGAFDECSPICLIRGLQYEKPKSDFDMEAISYPQGVGFRAIFKSLVSNLVLRFLLLISAPSELRGRYRRRREEQLNA